MKLTIPAAVLLLSDLVHAQSFSIFGGQIFTPGFVVVDAPQLGTPLGGETLHVAIDITANGRINQPPYPKGSENLIHNITIFLFSTDTGRNFTVTNTNGPVGDILGQESGSTVKHINWLWPDCLVGDGKPMGPSDRGAYNISILQSFRLNGKDHYTIFNLPIYVTSNIPSDPSRPTCSSVNNPLLPLNETINDPGIPVLFAPGDTTTPLLTSITGQSQKPLSALGTPKPFAIPANGLSSQ